MTSHASFNFAGKIGNTNDYASRKACRYVCSKAYIGDWFVLYQISKNVNMYFFRAFIKELRRDLKLSPKPKKGIKKGPLTEKPPTYLAANHIGPYPPLNEDDEDGFEDSDLGDPEAGSSLQVDLPEEESSLLGEGEAHDAPTL